MKTDAPRDNTADLQALANALEVFTQTTQKMEEAYHRLEERVSDLDRELAEKNRELALTTEYLGNLLESMSDGVVAVDPQGIITRFNQAAHAILGYTAEDVEGRPFEAVFQRAFDAPKMPGAMELRAKSGRKIPVSERDSSVQGQHNTPLGKVKAFQDLSELTALREQVRQIDRLAAIGEMAATVAHEIRNPLGGIRGFASFLARDIPEKDPRRRLVEKILAGADSLDKVVNELLEYTRPVELTLRPLACNGPIQAALAYLSHDAPRVTLDNQVDDGLRVLGDPDKLRQVFLNVLLNALQSMEGPGRIQITAQAAQTHVTIRVQDDGCGMSEEECGKIFSPFFTTKEKGTGLGLAVSEKIIEGHGGSITAQSVSGAGTTIAIRLPRAE